MIKLHYLQESDIQPSPKKRFFDDNGNFDYKQFEEFAKYNSDVESYSEEELDALNKYLEMCISNSSFKQNEGQIAGKILYGAAAIFGSYKIGQTVGSQINDNVLNPLIEKFSLAEKLSPTEFTMYGVAARTGIAALLLFGT